MQLAGTKATNPIWIVPTRFWLIHHQTEFCLVQINQNSVDTIQIWIQLTRFGKEFSLYGWTKMCSSNERPREWLLGWLANGVAPRLPLSSVSQKRGGDPGGQCPASLTFNFADSLVDSVDGSSSSSSSNLVEDVSLLVKGCRLGSLRVTVAWYTP